jgi:crotonobetainyl-CoA:carnitine CoA-transferase CaiB-like acyl-CoA transferase
MQSYGKSDHARERRGAPELRWPRSDDNRRRLLEGVRVLDLSRVLAGPYCSMVLADLGADVVKVEAPGGDQTRRWGPPFHEGTAAYYFGTNRNKWGIELDLTAESDRAAGVALLAEADVVIHNFTPRVARKLGVDYATVKALNDDVIHLAITAFGQKTSDRPGYDVVAQALCGLMASTGEADGRPVKVGVPISDLSAGLYGAIAISAALAARATTGAGTALEVSLYDATLALLANQSANALLCGEDTPRLGSEHPVLAPYGAFLTADEPLVIGAGTDEQFQSLCKAIGAPQLASDARFARNADRVAHRRELRGSLEAVLTREPRHVWASALESARVPHAEVRTVSQALRGAETETVASVEHPVLGSIAQVMGPIKVDGGYLAPYLAPPTLGEHNAAILRDGVGGSDEPATDRRDGLIGPEPWN